MKEIILPGIMICLTPNTILFLMMALCYLISLIKAMCIYIYIDSFVSECVSLRMQGKTQNCKQRHTQLFLSSIHFLGLPFQPFCPARHCLELRELCPCTNDQISAQASNTFKQEEQLCLLAVNSQTRMNHSTSGSVPCLCMRITSKGYSKQCQVTE